MGVKKTASIPEMTSLGEFNFASKLEIWNQSATQTRMVIIYHNMDMILVLFVYLLDIGP